MINTKWYFTFNVTCSSLLHGHCKCSHLSALQFKPWAGSPPASCSPLMFPPPSHQFSSFLVWVQNKRSVKQKNLCHRITFWPSPDLLTLTCSISFFIFTHHILDLSSGLTRRNTFWLYMCVCFSTWRSSCRASRRVPPQQQLWGALPPPPLWAWTGPPIPP